MALDKQELPIDDFLASIASAFQKNKNLIISASPGAGKTTRVPVALSQVSQKQIWVLEPRRIAAMSSASRIAEENQWTLGEQVGYQVRFEKKFSQNTQILFLTEALLLRKMKEDPELKNVSAVILDEFHERSVHVDLALAVLKELQESFRPDLKMVVMSATLNTKILTDYLPNAPVFEVPGRIFPQKIIFQDKAQLLRTGPDFTERISSLVSSALRQQPEGDLLCFLPGRGEIERLKQKLLAVVDQSFEIHTLHGQMNLQEQRSVLVPSVHKKRKIILATNIAESSLTIDGVRIVVDSGLVRQQQLDPRTGFEALLLTRISKASATQRAGRASRQAPGVVYRAWTSHEESSQKDFETPEIERVDLAESLLLLASHGVSHFESFSWLSAPPARTLQQSLDFLIALGVLDSQSRLTPLGQKLSDLPLHPRLAKLLIVGQQKECVAFSCEIAALLSERRGGQQDSSSEAENDLFFLWQQWKKKRSTNPSMDRVVEQLLRLIPTSKSNRVDLLPEEQQIELMNELLFEVYSDRLCRRRAVNSAEAKMVGGRGVVLHPKSSVKKSSYFLAIEVMEGLNNANSTIFTAVGLTNDFIKTHVEPLAEPFSQMEWDEDKGKFWFISGSQWKGVSLGSVDRRSATAEEIQDRWAELILRRWDLFLQKNKSLAQWLARVDFLANHNPNFEALTEEQKKNALEQACFGEKSLEAVENKGMVAFFQNQLNPLQKQMLEQQCPSHWVVPTGNRFHIEYSKEQGPFVEVRLQELFGLSAAPLICGQSLTLFLLAPNYRPVQVTRDLASFWKNGYVDVRKEMRSRYPKHSWPDDPTTAAPQAKGRPRNS